MEPSKNLNCLLLTGIALCLCMVWVPGYFLTGDGPCHVYNAKILHDLWVGKDTLFYSRFYEILRQPNPNWFTTVALASLMFVANGVVAEKIFLTLYILIYISGFYLLLQKITSKRSYWMLAIFIFVFTSSLAKGFYNYSFSIAFYFWVVYCWLRFLEKNSMGKALAVLLFVTLTFFTHLLPFVFSAFTCAALIFSYGLSHEKINEKERIRYIVKNGFVLLLLLLPFIGLMIWFTEKEGGMRMALYPFLYRLIELIQLKYLINLSWSELMVTTTSGVILLVVALLAVYWRIKQRNIKKYDGFLLSLLFVSFVYLCFPDYFLGRMILISLRVQLFVCILIICFAGYAVPSGKVKNIIGLAFFACFIILCAQRLLIAIKASDAEEEYLSCVNFIKPQSVVLPLNFAPSGKDEKGNVIADGNWVFAHAAQYLGTLKPLIVLDNYEANMGYFPLKWKDDTNPYWHLSKDESIEGNPPYASITDYRKYSKVTIDYILMWCYDSSALKNEHFHILYDEINAGYNKIYTSPTSRCILYAKADGRNTY